MIINKRESCLLTGWTFYCNTKYRNIRLEILNKNPDYGKNGNYSDVSNLHDLEPTKLKWYLMLVDKEQKMRKAIIEELRNRGYHFSGDYHQLGEFGAPIFNNSFIYCCSLSEWGQIMSDAFPYEKYEGMSGDSRYLKWSTDSDDLKEEVKLPDGYDEVYVKRAKFWKELPYTRIGEID